MIEKVNLNLFLSYKMILIEIDRNLKIAKGRNKVGIDQKLVH